MLQTILGNSRRRKATIGVPAKSWLMSENVRLSGLSYAALKRATLAATRKLLTLNWPSRRNRRFSSLNTFPKGGTVCGYWRSYHIIKVVAIRRHFGSTHIFHQNTHISRLLVRVSIIREYIVNVIYDLSIKNSLNMESSDGKKRKLFVRGYKHRNDRNTFSVWQTKKRW